MMPSITPPVCDCCHRAVQEVRSSIWRGQARICIACFFVWYYEGITDPAILGPEIVRREQEGRWPFPNERLAAVGFG